MTLINRNRLPIIIGIGLLLVVLVADAMRRPEPNRLREEWKKSSSVTRDFLIGKVFQLASVKGSVKGAPSSIRFLDGEDCLLNEWDEAHKISRRYQIRQNGTLYMGVPYEGQTKFLEFQLRRVADRLWYVDAKVCKDCNVAHQLYYSDWTKQYNKESTESHVEVGNE